MFCRPIIILESVCLIYIFSKKRRRNEVVLPYFLCNVFERINSIHVKLLFRFPLIGKGRGRQVIAVARTSDLIIMMLDAAKGEIQK